MGAVLVILTLFVIVATLLPVIRSDAWWIRVFDFPRLQLTALGVALLAAHLVSGTTAGLTGKAAVPLLALCILWQGFRIFPYTPLAPRQVHSGNRERPADRFSLMIANVLMTNRKAEAFLEIVAEKNPDVLLVVEPDTWWEGTLGVLDEAYPHQVRYPQNNTYGMLLYSRLPLTRTRLRFLVEDDVPSIFTDVALPSGAVFTLVGLHPRPPRPDKNQDSTHRDAELSLVGKELERCAHPTVVAGDLNDVAWSHTTRLFQRLSGLLDPRRGRGFFSTFHARYPFLRYPLDHVFHTEHFRLIRLARLRRFGSDHFPIFVELSYEPAGKNRQEAPEADREDRVEADAMIVKALGEAADTGRV